MKRILFILLLVSSLAYGQTPNVMTLGGNVVTVPSGGAAVVNSSYYLSQYGNDGNDGRTTATPKRTPRAIDTLLAASTVATPLVFLEGGSIFRGTDGIVLDGRGNVVFNAYNRTQAGKYKLPILVGTDVFNTGWTLTGSNTYQQNIPNTVTISFGNYAYINVIEIDTALEKIQPLTARRYLTYVGSAALVETTPGSYFCPVVSPASSPAFISMHTSDNASPNNHAKYRYEVVTRDRAINKTLTSSPYGNGVSVSNFFGMDFAQGTGPFASRMDSFYIKNSVMMGSALHLLVCGNYSTVDNVGFMAGDNTNQSIANVFYQITGANETNTVMNSTYLNCQEGVYTHTSGTGASHGKLLFKNNYVFGATKYVVQAANCDTTEVDNVYLNNSGSVLRSGSSISFLKNTVANTTTTLVLETKNSFVNNCLIKSKPGTPSLVWLQSAGNGDKASFTKNIFHFKNTTAGISDAGVLFNFDATARLNAKNNIVIVDVPTTGYVNIATTDNSGGLASGPNRLDSNVYVILKGNLIWKTTNLSLNGGDPSIFSLAQWQTQSGQDLHSIVIDLRTTTNSLKTIFNNPEAGDYTLTNSVQADSIRTLLCGMYTPPTTFIATPTKDDIVAHIENGMPYKNSSFPDIYVDSKQNKLSLTTTGTGLPTLANDVINIPQGGSGWSLTGNAGTNISTNFIGTTDNIPLYIKTNGVLGAYLDVNKNFSVMGDFLTGSNAVRIWSNAGLGVIDGLNGSLALTASGAAGTGLTITGSGTTIKNPSFINLIASGQGTSVNITADAQNATINLGSYTTVTSLPRYGRLQGYSFNDYGSNKPVNILLLGGTEIGSGNKGNVFMAHDGTNRFGTVGIGTVTPTKGSELEVFSPNKGILPPRMTQVQRDSINLQVVSVTVTNGGTGYTSAPTVTFSNSAADGITALSGAVTRASNIVTAISAPTETGSYNNTPTITITGGGGTGATAIPVIAQVLPEGLEIYNTTTHKGQQWNNSAWVDLVGGSSGITAITGDMAASGTGSVAATLATVNSNVGPFGSATSIPIPTVNAKGLTTAMSTATIPLLVSASFSPTLTAGTNATTLNAYSYSSYVRVGNITRFSICGSVIPSTTGYVIISITLPVSITGTNGNIIGAGVVEEGATVAPSPAYVYIINSTTVEMRYKAQTTGTGTFTLKLDCLN